MIVPFSAEDLGRVFDGRALMRARSLMLAEAVDLTLDEPTIRGIVRDGGIQHTAALTPCLVGKRISFTTECSCSSTACAHLAAVALAALDRYPELRKVQQASFLDTMLTGKNAERLNLYFDLSPGRTPHACVVTCVLESDKTSRITGTTPKKILIDPDSDETARAIARQLGSADTPRVGVTGASAPGVLAILVQSGQARLSSTGKKLTPGEERVFAKSAQPNLPPKSLLIMTETGPWYVDSSTGTVGRIRLSKPAGSAKRATGIRGKAKAPEPRRLPVRSSVDPVIVDRPLVPVLRLRAMQAADDFGRKQRLDALVLDLDYDGGMTHVDDERQFIKLDSVSGPLFIRRDRPAEMAAFDMLKDDGFMQMRLADPNAARGRRVFVYRGRDAGERWQRFMAERVPALEALGWRSEIEGDFGPRFVEAVGEVDVKITDGEAGEFSLELGIEIDGVRHPLLPILNHILDRGGFEAGQVIDGELITSLEDGRVLKLPAEKMRRLIATLSDLIESGRRGGNSDIVLPVSEAPTVLELEDILATRWQNATEIQAQVERFRENYDIPTAVIPPSFTISLRPYQQQGVDWLQHLRANSLAGILADDMGLGKTAQAIAHIAIEKEEGRLDRPALIVVPTSLVPNWVAELNKFAPSLKIEVLHGLQRHEKRNQLAGIDVVITTYTVLARDIEEMKEIPWHIVVLDEAQAIKSPDAKATRAVCQLDTRHRVCLSGTPIENNLEELWSEFVFLLPGLLGDRKSFAKRFRTPIEKKNDAIRRTQLVRRIKPFIMRRTKSEVAKELPPKHTVLRRVELAPNQRELYDTIRAMLHEEVLEQISAHSPSHSRFIVLDALLKLRQVCCDPRLVKLPSARLVDVSSKLDDLMEMVTEMIPEGRRILLFSQFTSMLDLIKPRLEAAGIPFVELRGATKDRAEPVRAFEAGEVPLFLISLKAGGKGINLTSADTVIHYDPWWNPAVEDQASDRAHRIGQTKSVFVYKMIASRTVEERMIELQQRKAALAGIALSGNEEMPDLDFSDIDYLFGPDSNQEAA